MPELAEARIIADELSVLVGHTITDIEVYTDKYMDLSVIINKKVVNVFSYGKRVIIELDEGFIYNTLSMTGKWLIPSKWEGSQEFLAKSKEYMKLKIVYGNDYVFFSDVRTFGDVKYLSSMDDELSMLGPGSHI